MEREDILSIVVKIISEKLTINPATIDLTSLFHEDLGADSLDQVEIIMAIEDEFDISISDEDLEKIKNVKDLVDYLSDKV